MSCGSAADCCRVRLPAAVGIQEPQLSENLELVLETERTVRRWLLFRLNGATAAKMRSTSWRIPGAVATTPGRNGVRKTSLLHVIVGHRQPGRGIIEWAGRDVTRAAPQARPVDGIACVPRGHEMFGLR